MTLRSPRSPEVPMNTDVPVDLANSIDAFCDKTGVKKKKIVELALRQWLRTEAERAAKERK